MNTTVITEIILLTLSITVVWFGFFWLYRDHTVDQFRQRMFELRDQLFDDAAKGLISFDHPSYLLMRSAMNGFLKFGHRISLFEMVLSRFLVRVRPNNSFIGSLNKSLKHLDAPTTELIIKYRTRMVELVVIQAITASPIFLVFILSYIVPLSFLSIAKKAIVQHLSSLWSEPINKLESTALAYGR